MALPRKGSRNITVDGTTYRWRLRHKPTYSQALAWSPCTYAVEHADEAGTTLVVTTDRPHPGNWLGHDSKPVLPCDVTQAIQRALHEGWIPTAPGSPFHLNLSAGPTPPP
jgi:hypothetical protein